jgi:5-methylcytosine-specific restriction endonuclease McrA
MIPKVDMSIFRQQALRTDIAGIPLEWIGFETAAKLYTLNHVVYTLGSPLYTIHGGINSRTGLQSNIQVNSILATQSLHHKSKNLSKKFVPTLNNATLFKRDNHICLYCGIRHPRSELSRDHITPLSLNGKDHWNNVVTACKRCNNAKADRSLENSGLELLAIPFTPTYAEYIFLQGRNILADQMQFLRSHFPQESPLHQRLRVL